MPPTPLEVAFGCLGTAACSRSRLSSRVCVRTYEKRCYQVRPSRVEAGLTSSTVLSEFVSRNACICVCGRCAGFIARRRHRSCIRVQDESIRFFCDSGICHVDTNSHFFAFCSKQHGGDNPTKKLPAITTWQRDKDQQPIPPRHPQLKKCRVFSLPQASCISHQMPSGAAFCIRPSFFIWIYSNQLGS